MPELFDPSRHLTGRRLLTRPRLFSSWLPPERVPFPCHPRMPAMLFVDHDRSIQRWEFACTGRDCERLYRFTKHDGWLRWEPIESLTPTSKPLLGRSSELDSDAVMERLTAEAQPAVR